MRANQRISQTPRYGALLQTADVVRISGVPDDGRLVHPFEILISPLPTSKIAAAVASALQRHSLACWLSFANAVEYSQLPSRYSHADRVCNVSGIALVILGVQDGRRQLGLWKQADHKLHQLYNELETFLSSRDSLSNLPSSIRALFFINRIWTPWKLPMLFTMVSVCQHYW